MPSGEALARLKAVVIAGHRGRASTARKHLTDRDPHVRAAAYRALQRCAALDIDGVQRAIGDPDPIVRREAATLAIGFPNADLIPLLTDPEPSVTEIACFACGERSTTTDPVVAQISSIATDHVDPLCRESAAAALGAIGDPAGLEAVLAACDDKPAIRRRAVLALAAFDDARADAALRRALDDRDWQVRQAAEDLLEINRSLDAISENYPDDPAEGYAENG